MRRISVLSKLISLLLVFATVVSFLPLNIIALESGSEVTETQKQEPELAPTETVAHEDCVSVIYNGAVHRTVSLPEDGKETLSIFTVGEKPTNISWQIRTPDADRWVNIYGESGENLAVTYSLIGSMLNEKGSAFIRVQIKHADAVCVSDPVEIKLVHNIAEDDSTHENAGIYALRAPMMMAAAEEGEFEIYNIVINYIFDNGALAFEPYGASVAKNSDFSKEVESPTVVGYNPVMRVGEEYVDASVVFLNYTNITSNITVNVIYEPAIVDYQVHHHLQDLYDDGYSVTPDIITYGKGLTGSIVPKGVELGEDELPGFKPLAYECLEIAADGSTVIEIRYERNYYLIDFDMDGGYGVEPLYIRYESEVGANVPIRHGYIFERWELVSFGGEEPSVEEASKYDINSSIIITPNANLVYRAVWTTQLVNYTMVFWHENADDNKFSFWGSLDNLKAMSGAYVNGADRVSEVSYITDESNFTYMDALTDKNVLVEGDGSTIVNVYYARNRYSITFKAAGLCTIPENHTHTDACYLLLCDNEHVHTDECIPSLDCETPIHSAHTDACIVCGLTVHAHSSACCNKTEHTHTTSCFNNVGTASNTPAGAPTNVENGYIFAVESSSWWNTTYTYYIHINGVWYRYNGRNASSGDVVNSKCNTKEEHTHGEGNCPCTLEEHSHIDSCYKDVLHEHADHCYSYSCNANSHTHIDGCYVLNCATVTNHTHSSNCKKSSSSNTVKTVMRKYEENLESIWPVVDDNGKSYNNGERWSPSGSSTYSQVLVYIANMPGESFTLTMSEGQNKTYEMNYYLEVLEGEEYDKVYNNKKFKLYTTVKAKYNHITEAEDFFNINGFYKFASDPAFSSGQISMTNGGTVNFYYGRIIDHYLKFRSNGEIINERTVHEIPYGALLKNYNFVPDYPLTLEPNAYFFDGWYTTPDHFAGTEVDWNTITMDEGDITLYAKWSPMLHSVSVYLDSTLQQQIGSTQLVSHGNFASAPTETVKKGDYIFQGWFYTKDGEEKAFVFTGIPIVNDLKVYAKWSSHVTVNYKINYVLYNSDPNAEKTVIADATVGSGIAGNNKTFYAKAGSELYSGYEVGYYPLTSSHTVTMSAEDINHEFTFEYVYVESMPYKVLYLGENGEQLLAPKIVSDNTLSVVTETFVKLNKKMPDAYQKRLVLSADGKDTDGDGVYDSNVIVFNYKSDEEHAYYKVVHYIENLHGSGYREYRSEDVVGVIGNTYSITPITLTGFSYNPYMTLVNGELYPTTAGAVSATLTSDGLLIELYYNRVQYEYTVRYLEINTNKVLYTEKKSAGIFGEQIIEYAPGLTNIGYKPAGESVVYINLSANESLNVITFYYVECTYSIKYQIVGSPEGASLTQSSEPPLKAVTGVPTGSTPVLNPGYHFEGWFLNAACTHPVPESWVDENGHITPKSDGIWLSDHTYYAKVEPDFTTLTVKTLGVADVDTGEMFIFRIKGISEKTGEVDLNVTVVGNSTVTVTHLPAGEYLVTELVGWAYRYTPDAEYKTIVISYSSVGDNLVTFSHLRTNVNWLDGNDNKYNIYQ